MPFISFEGGEGAGKSTQIKRLAAWLGGQGHAVLTTREPGGTPAAEAIRELLIRGAGDKWLPLSEALLLYAARFEHAERLIKPALAAGKIVLCDRFADSTMAYQGYAMGLGPERISEVQRLALGSFQPDLTIIFDIDPQIGLARAVARDGNKARYEAMPLTFHQALQRAYHEIAAASPDRCVIVDAARDIEAVSDQVQAIIQQRMAAI